MSSRRTCASAPAADASSHASAGSRVINFSSLRSIERGGLLAGAAGAAHRASAPDPGRDDPTAARLVGPAPLGAQRTVAEVDEYALRTRPSVSCVNGPGCLCPSSVHVTERERAVMSGIARSSARLSTALWWIFALVALAALVLLLR